MSRTTEREVTCRVTEGGAWVLCPVCRRGKVLKLTVETRAQGLVLYCRNCKHESVVEIAPGGRADGLPGVRLAAKKCPKTTAFSASFQA